MLPKVKYGNFLLLAILGNFGCCGSWYCYLVSKSKEGWKEKGGKAFRRPISLA